MEKEIGVIGGGASGMVASIIAARNGAKVVIYERMNRLGKKILATGNGRCNMTNINLKADNLRCIHGKNKEFASNILKRFTVEDTINFFEVLGIAHKVEDGGKVFPMSNQAGSVLDVLRYEIEKLGVQVIYDVEIEEIIQFKNKFVLKDIEGSKYESDKVIIATGGKSSPNLGSNGSGYELTRKLGHKIIKPFPALVQLNLESSFLKAIKGVKFDGQASIIVNNKTLRTEEGEILFTNYGISGPPILQLSRKAIKNLENKQKPIMKVDMFPKYTYQELLDLISLRLSYQYDRPLDFSFIGLINKKLIPIILKEANIQNPKKLCYETSNKEIEKIARLLKNWQFKIVGCQSWKHSQVTAGGVDSSQVNSETLESKLIPGIYIAGELLDIDGDCGGFNLQWAWSSGYLAGTEAAVK